MSERCLFSAPFDFMDGVFEGLPFAVDRRTVWERAELRPDPEATAWVVNTGWRFCLDERDLDLFPRLRVLATPSTGADHIDLAAVRRRGIVFLSLLDARAALEEIAASAEYAFLLLLNTLRRLPVAARLASQGLWRRDDETLVRGHELQGRRVGLLGRGRIGRRLARYCEAFGASVHWYDPYVCDSAPGRVGSLVELFARSDSLVLCCTLTEETHNLVDGRLLALLPPGATLVNISRGEILAEADLAALLAQRPDIAVGLDVLAGEPLDLQHASPLMPWIDQGRVVLTPHIGGCTRESQTKAARIALDLVARALQSSSSASGT